MTPEKSISPIKLYYKWNDSRTKKINLFETKAGRIALFIWRPGKGIKVHLMISLVITCLAPLKLETTCRYVKPHSPGSGQLYFWRTFAKLVFGALFQTFWHTFSNIFGAPFLNIFCTLLQTFLAHFFKYFGTLLQRILGHFYNALEHFCKHFWCRIATFFVHFATFLVHFCTTVLLAHFFKHFWRTFANILAHF